MKNKAIYTVIITTLLCIFAAGGCGGTTSGEVVTPSDYSKAENWLAIPAEHQCSADVIYFYPTAYSRTSPDIQPVVCAIDDAGMKAQAEETFKKQATAFETAADIYAPFYRQTDGLYVLTLAEEKKDALLSGAPLADAKAALDYYFEHYNHGRPYILAAHSQGSNVLRLLMADYMKKHPDRYKNMVAAYILGYSIDKKYMDANKNLKFAEGAMDTGVIISYNTEAPKVSGNDPVWLSGSIAINPLSWTRGAEKALSADNLGSLTKELADGSLSLDIPGIADAYLNLERGTVVCSTVEQAKYEMPVETEPLFGRGIYHGGDYSFYYMNIRQNAKDRIKAFLAK